MCFYGVIDSKGNLHLKPVSAKAPLVKFESRYFKVQEVVSASNLTAKHLHQAKSSLQQAFKVPHGKRLEPA
jgi:hypothetical protein